MTTSPRKIADLDFDAAKRDLREFMSGQDAWADFDFEASGLSAFLDGLAYDRHNTSFFANMLGSEMYIDSARLRESVVSRAKELSYTPRSVRAASAVVDVDVRGVSGVVVLPKGTRFSGTGSEGSVFTVVESVSEQSTAAGRAVLREVMLREGVYSTEEYAFGPDGERDGITLSSATIDTSLVEVYVQEGSDDFKTARYSRVTSVVDVGPDSKVFYLEEGDGGRPVVRFGDGVLGKRVGHGKVVRVVVFETSGEGGNGASVFKLSRVPGHDGAVATVRAHGRSSGGAVAESMESVRFLAPRHMVSRDRAVSTDDWSTVVLENFPDVASVKTWGGDEDPDGEFAVVYIAINPMHGTPMTTSRKDEIVKILKKRFRMPGTTPKIVDPDVTWLVLGVRAVVDPRKAPVDSTEVKEAIRETLRDYSTTNLEAFDEDFEHSRASHAADSVHVAVTSTEIEVWVENRIGPDVGKTSSYEIHFRNQIEPGSVTSNPFTWNDRIVQMTDRDDRIDFFVSTETGVKVVLESAGRVDHTTGVVVIDPVVIQKGNAKTKDLRVRAKPSTLNVSANRNKILRIDADTMRVDVIPTGG